MCVLYASFPAVSPCWGGGFRMLGPLQSFTKAQIEGPPVLRPGLSTSWTAPDTSRLSWSTCHPAKANAKIYKICCLLCFCQLKCMKETVQFRIQLSDNTTTWPVRTCCQVRFCDCSLQLHATTCEWVSGTRQKTQWEIIEGRHMSDRLQPKSQRHRALPCISRVKRATLCNSLVPNQKVGWNSARTFCLCANCAHDAIHSHIATLHILPAWLAETPFNFSVTWWPKVFNQQQWCTCQGFCKQETYVSFPTMTQAPKYHYHIWQDCVSISAFHKTTPGKILLLVLGLLHTRDCCAGLLVFIRNRNPFSAPAKTVASTLLIWMKSGMQSKMLATRTQSSTDGRKLNSNCQSHLSLVCICRSCKYRSYKCLMIWWYVLKRFMHNYHAYNIHACVSTSTVLNLFQQAGLIKVIR